MLNKNLKTRYAHSIVRQKNERIVFFVFIISLLLLNSNKFYKIKEADAAYATTTVMISICGNAIVDGTEACDDGTAFNDGIYSSSTLTRRCAPNCRTYGPYCGDGILQAYYSEECDDEGNVSGDKCSAVCKQEVPPVSSSTPPNPPATPSGDGGGSGGAVPVRAQTQVILEGRAYPNSRVQILKDGQLVGLSQADSEAKFS